MKKRGQITLFIILGVVIVSGIIALFIFTRGADDVNTPAKLGPKGFIDKCVRDAVEDSVEEILASGGILEPYKVLRYNKTNYTYLCYIGDNFKPCYNLYPNIEEKIEKQVKANTNNAVTKCFLTLREDFENKGYDVMGNDTNYTIDIGFGEVKINIDKPITITGLNTSQNFRNFDTKIILPLDGMIRTVDKIISSEINFCDFDTARHMLLNPKEKVQSRGVEGSKIYTIIDRDTGVVFKFATRSCTTPPAML